MSLDAALLQARRADLIALREQLTEELGCQDATERGGRPRQRLRRYWRRSPKADRPAGPLL